MPELELFLIDKNDTSWSLRPWLLLVHFGIPFAETSFVAADSETPARIRAVPPTERVPASRVGNSLVWESLAIVETLADLYPELSIWPPEPGRRMHARSIATEMRRTPRRLRRDARATPDGATLSEQRSERELPRRDERAPVKALSVSSLRAAPQP